MNQEKADQFEAEIAAAHQEINLLRCRLDATGALVLVYAIMIALDFDQWVSIGVGILAAAVYGAILWRSAHKPFERLMKSE